MPTHPDGAAGLGFLEVVQGHSWLLVLAISLTLSASFAEELIVGMMSFDSLYAAVALMRAGDAALFLGAPLVFSTALWTCHVKGLADYTEFAQRYVGGFDRKWLGERANPDEPLLGTPDLQSLADQKHRPRASNAPGPRETAPGGDARDRRVAADAAAVPDQVSDRRALQDGAWQTVRLLMRRGRRAWTFLLERAPAACAQLASHDQADGG